MAVTSNRLIPILGVVGLAIVGVVLFKQFSGGPTKAGAPLTTVPAPDLPKTAGADSDTPTETLKTVVASNAELRKQVEEVLKRNKELLDENKRLRGTPGAAADAAAAEAQAEAQAAAPERSALDQALDTAGRAADAVVSGFPSGGLKRTPQAPAPAPAAPAWGDAAPAAESARGAVHYALMPPMGYAIQTEQSGGKQGVPMTRFVRTTLPSAGDPGTLAGNGPASRAARAAASDKRQRQEDTPYFTLPENATLVGATAMTSIIGRVPIDGRVTDPMQFKLVIGRDNLAANGFELPPDIAGMIVTGVAIGDMALSCSEGRVRSATFVFNDGSIRTVSTRRSGRGTTNTRGGLGGGGLSDDLGFISDAHGNPCISGTFVTNAPAYLTDIVGLKALGVAGQAYAQAQTMTRSNYDGSITSAVTGSVGDYALGQAVAGATDEVTKWMLQRLKSSFDAVITPSGQKIVVHLDQEIRIDKAVNPRKLVHRQQASNQITRGERYGLE